MTPITDPSSVRLGHWYSIEDQPERMIASDGELQRVCALLGGNYPTLVVFPMGAAGRAQRAAQVQADAERMQAGA